MHNFEIVFRLQYVIHMRVIRNIFAPKHFVIKYCCTFDILRQLIISHIIYVIRLLFMIAFCFDDIAVDFLKQINHVLAAVNFV